MSCPKVTIGITAFNAANTIETAVHSALSQTWRPTEIIAIDDRSTDDTANILTRLSTGRPEMRVFFNRHNEGVAVARNRILDKANGEFVAFFDDDDYSLPERIDRQVNRILTYERNFANGAPVICHTAREVCYPEGTRRLDPTKGQQTNRCAPNGLAVAERVLLGKPLKDGYGACATCSQMARLATYRAVGGLDPAFRRSEDSEFVIHLAKVGGHFVGITKALVIQNMTNTRDNSLGDERRYLLMMLEKHRDIPDKYGLYGFCRRWIGFKQAWLEGRLVDSVTALLNLTVKHPLPAVRRLLIALPHFGQNRAYSRFHSGIKG